MNAYLVSLLIAAGSGALWSIIQFMSKYADPKNDDVLSFDDFRWELFGQSVIMNTFGGVCAVIAAFLLGSAPGWQLSVISGLYGEKGIQLLFAVKDRLQSKG